MLNMICQRNWQRTMPDQQQARYGRRKSPAVVVIMEHALAVLELMEEVLQSEGYIIHGFTDHDQLNAAIQHICPDLLILDAHPQRVHDSISMIRQLRGNKSLHAMPIIIDSTDRRLLESVTTLLDDQRCSTFEKPFDIDYFLQCVQSEIESAWKTSRIYTAV